MREQTSNFTLGGLLILLGAAVLLGGYAPGLRDFASAEYFPALIAVCMCVGGVFLIAIGWLARDIPPVRWTWWQLLLAALITVASTILLAMYFSQQFLAFGPAEYAGTILFLLAASVALARRSHLRAFDMVLIGLLLSTFGIDVVTGRLRFTFGAGAFLNGMDILAVAPGILVIGEALLCLVSPKLWFSTFTRWLVPALAIGPRWPLLLRALSAIAIAASLWLAWEVHHNPVDILFALFFGAFGAVCMLLGWNRVVLCFALFYGPQLEQSLRQALYVSEGNYSVFIERPFSLIHLAFALGLLTAAFALWLWRVISLHRKNKLDRIL